MEWVVGKILKYDLGEICWVIEDRVSTLKVITKTKGEEHESRPKTDTLIHDNIQYSDVSIWSNFFLESCVP